MEEYKEKHKNVKTVSLWTFASAGGSFKFSRCYLFPFNRKLKRREIVRNGKWRKTLCLFK